MWKFCAFLCTPLPLFQCFNNNLLYKIFWNVLKLFFTFIFEQNSACVTSIEHRENVCFLQILFREIIFLLFFSIVSSHFIVTIPILCANQSLRWKLLPHLLIQSLRLCFQFHTWLEEAIRHNVPAFSSSCSSKSSHM